MTKSEGDSEPKNCLFDCQKSYDRMIIGQAAKLCGCIPVERAQDF